MNTNKKMRLDPEIQGQLCRIVNTLKRDAAMELNLYMTCDGEIAIWDGASSHYHNVAHVDALLEILLNQDWFDDCNYIFLINLEKKFTKCAEMVRQRRLEVWPLDRPSGQK